MLEDYLNAKNAKDLMDLGVIPKTSSAHMALITYRRLESLRDKILGEINDEMLGTWNPAMTVVNGNYQLAQDVVVDNKLGHIAKFKVDFKDPKGNTIPAGTTGRLIGYSKPSSYSGSSQSPYLIFHAGEKTDCLLALNQQTAEALEVSSLGQIEPKDKELAVREEAFNEFFPTTVLDTETSEDVLLALLMGKDMVFYGPPGSGKTNVALDIINLASKSQKIVFTVDGCRVQCNPYSLLDDEFAKKVHPCPECMIKYDPKFKETGLFRKPKPSDVKVLATRYGEGHGIESSEGTVTLSRMHLAGYKIPKLDGTVTQGMENDYDPEGFRPGILSRTNNGIWHLDEVDKLRPQALDNLLESLNRNSIQPEQLRYSYPSNYLFLGTANDSSSFSGAFNDRVFLIPIRYPKDVDTSYGVTKKAYHGETTKVDEILVRDTHRQKWDSLSEIPMPVIIEKAIDAFYIKFRKEYNGSGKTDVSGSVRSKLDALNAARANLILDGIFFKKTPKIANASYAIKGIEHALFARLQEKDAEMIEKTNKEISDWVEKEFSAVLKNEEDTWWCEAYKFIAISSTQIPEIHENFVKEIATYKENPKAAVSTFKKVKSAYAHNPGTEDLEFVKIQSPFMNYLFKQQPNFLKLENEGQLIELVNYLMESSKNTTCKI